jgi:hypothetical protein
MRRNAGGRLAAWKDGHTMLNMVNEQQGVGNPSKA